MSGVFLFFYYFFGIPLGFVVAVMGFCSITALIAWLFFDVPAGFHGFWTAGVIALGAYVVMMGWIFLVQFVSRQHLRLRDRFLPRHLVLYYFVGAPLGVIVAVMAFWSVGNLFGWLFLGVASAFHDFWKAGLIALGGYAAMLGWGLLIQTLTGDRPTFRGRLSLPRGDASFFEER